MRASYSLDLSLSSTSSISTLQVQELCLVSLQQPQYLSTRTLFDGLSLLSQLLLAIAATKFNTLPTVKVSSAYIYYCLRPLHFVSSLRALCIRACPSYSNTIL
jgi:hypothetical protein